MSNVAWAGRLAGLVSAVWKVITVGLWADLAMVSVLGSLALAHSPSPILMGLVSVGWIGAGLILCVGAGCLLRMPEKSAFLWKVIIIGIWSALVLVSVLGSIALADACPGPTCSLLVGLVSVGWTGAGLGLCLGGGLYYCWRW
jgi:hypothetical protein